MIALIIPDAKGTDAELDVFFFGKDTVGHALYQLIDIIPPPVVDRLKALAILPELLCIGNGILFRVWVKIIVEVNTVDIIVSYHIHYNRRYIAPNLWKGRVEVFLPSVGEKPLRLG